MTIVWGNKTRLANFSRGHCGERVCFVVFFIIWTSGSVGDVALRNVLSIALVAIWFSRAVPFKQ